MIVLDAGARVTQVRFLPDGRLLVGTWAAGDAELLILPLPSGPRVVIPLPTRQVWEEPNRIAIPLSSDRFYSAFGAIRTHDAVHGRELAHGPSGPASEVIVSPDGQRLVGAYREYNGDFQLAEYDADGQRVWATSYPYRTGRRLAGFLPDADQYVLVGDRELCVVRWAIGADSDAVRFPYESNHVRNTHLSPDGRHLGVEGYSNFYLYDAATMNLSRMIKGRGDFNYFVGFAFHPAGRTLAVIHGGPTLVKLYDLDTLKLRTKLNWKVGKLTCVAYSPDGQLAAVGTDDGRVVVWDADE